MQQNEFNVKQFFRTLIDVLNDKGEYHVVSGIEKALKEQNFTIDIDEQINSDVTYKRYDWLYNTVLRSPLQVNIVDRASEKVYDIEGLTHDLSSCVPWEIQYAKSGDILIDKDGYMLAVDSVEKDELHPGTYVLSRTCALSEDDIFNMRNVHTNPHTFHPASIYEKDRFFRKMAEAGYQFDVNINGDRHPMRIDSARYVQEYHIGEWVIIGDDPTPTYVTYISYDSNGYLYWTRSNSTFREFDVVRRWTYKDVKAGDYLYNDKNKYIVIVKRVSESRITTACRFWVDHKLYAANETGWDDVEFVPATPV